MKRVRWSVVGVMRSTCESRVAAKQRDERCYSSGKDSTCPLFFAVLSLI